MFVNVGQDTLLQLEWLLCVCSREFWAGYTVAHRVVAVWL